jgi:hypothetical protein
MFGPATASSALELMIDAQSNASWRLRQESRRSFRQVSKPAIEKIEELLRDLNAIPEDIRSAVRNNGDGHAITACFRR